MKMPSNFGFKKKNKDREEDDEGSSRKSRLYDRSDTEAQSGKPSWMMTSRAEQKDAVREQRMQSGKRAPELFLQDGDEKTLRSCHEGPIAMIWQYSFQHDGKFRRFTAPARGEVDLFRKAGLKAQLRAIYEVIDYKGYRDKNEKRHRNVRRYLVVAARVHEQLETIRKKCGPMSDYDITVTRTGSDQSTTYTFIPSPPSKIEREARGKPEDSLADKVKDYYAPRSEAEQRIILRSKLSEIDENDEEDD